MKDTPRTHRQPECGVGAHRERARHIHETRVSAEQLVSAQARDSYRYSCRTSRTAYGENVRAIDGRLVHPYQHIIECIASCAVGDGNYFVARTKPRCDLTSSRAFVKVRRIESDGDCLQLLSCNL